MSASNPTPDRTAAEGIFHDAVEQPDAMRDDFVRRACAGNEALRAEVESLLEADRRAAESPTLATSLTPSKAVPTPDEGAGTHVGRYKLLQRIGEGGFGTVWLAEQREPVRRRVALKVIKLGMDTRQVITRFEAERQALAMMDHPNIAKVLDAGSTDARPAGGGRPYFVMEYIKGIPIVEYCDTERLDTRARLNLFIQVCHAIQHAHQKGIIHRDIKPGNVLVTMHDGTPVPKVIDFGIAKATSAELTQRTLFTEHRQFIGTPAYMSPEQAEMSALDIDTRSDIYSLGVLLYELLTGTTPFATDELLASGLAEMMRIIREVDPPRPSTRLSALGSTADRAASQRRADVRRLGTLLRGDLDWIAMKCLEKDRTRRYETASALAADIRRHLSDEPVLAGPPSAAYRAAKFVRRHRAKVVAAGAVGAVLALGLAGTIVGFVRAASEAELRVQQRDTATGALERIADEVRRRAAADGVAPPAEGSGPAGVTSDAAEPVQRLADSTVRLLEQLDMLRHAEVAQRTRAQHAADEALQSQRRAEQISVLLREILQSANPQRDGPQVPLIDVLRRAEGLLADRLDDQPLVELELRETLGKTFLLLASPRDAAPHLERALALAAAHAPPPVGGSTPDAERLRFEWLERWTQPAFKAAVEMGDPARGPRTITAVADSLQSERGGGDPTVEFLRRAADALGPAVKTATHPHIQHAAAPGRGRTDLLRERMEERRRDFGDEDVRTVDAMHELAGALSKAGQRTEADEWYERVGEIEGRVRRPDDPTRRRHALERAVAQASALPSDQALERLALAIAQDEAAAGPGQPETIDALRAIAVHRQRIGDVAGAGAALRQALQIAETKLGGAHPTTITLCLEVIPEMMQAGRADEAEAIIVKRIADVERSAGPSSPFFALLKTGYGHLLAARGQHEAAITVIREAIARYGATSALPDAQSWDPRSRLVTSLIELARWQEAETELEWFAREHSGPFAPTLQRQSCRLHVLYFERRHTADPAAGFDAKAAEWRAKLANPDRK